jgi:hypothetical protein
MFASAIAAVLSEYRIDVIRYVTDPRTGLPSSLKWMPTVAEVREACEARAQHLRKMERLANWGKNQPRLAYDPVPSAEARERVARLADETATFLRLGPPEEREEAERLKRDQNAAAFKIQQKRVKEECAALGWHPPRSPLALSPTCLNDMQQRDALHAPEDA